MQFRSSWRLCKPMGFHGKSMGQHDYFCKGMFTTRWCQHAGTRDLIIAKTVTFSIYSLLFASHRNIYYNVTCMFITVTS